MNEQPLLSVRGEAVLEVDPELASIAVTIAARDPERAKALRLLDERSRAIDGIFDAFAEAIDKVETTGVRVSPQLKNRKPQERIAGYVATVHHTVTVADFTRLGELIAQLADQDLTEINGPWWSLRPNSPVHRQARVEATHDAVRRARDYAEAVGSRLVGLVELADTQLLSGRHGASDSVALAAAGGPVRARGMVAPEEFTFDIAPARQTVYATVEARFRIAPPDLATVEPGPAAEA